MPEPKEIIRLGVGYDSVLDRPTNEAISYEDVVLTSGESEGPHAEYFCEVITSYRRLLHISDISVGATFKLGTIKASAQTRFFESFKYNSKSIYMCATCMVKNPSREIKGATLSTEAVALAQQDVNLFFAKYGDEYVYKHNPGGSIKILFEFQNIRTERETIVTARINAAKKFFNSGFSVNAELKDTLQEIQEDTSIRVYYFRNGDFEEIPELTFQNLDKEARAFVEAIRPGTGKDVVWSVETKPFLYVWNSPLELKVLPTLAETGRDYIEELYSKACLCQERIGDCRATTDNASYYTPQDVGIAKQTLPRLEAQLQELSEIYDNYTATRVIAPSLASVKRISIEAYAMPTPVDGPFALGFRFGRNALDSKIFLGEVISDDDFMIRVEGAMRFMGDPPLKNTWVYDRHRYLTAWNRDVYNNRVINLIGDDVRPVVFYYHDLITNDQVNLDIYDVAEGKRIKAGRYKLYVMINTKAKMYDVTTEFNTTPIRLERSVIDIEEGAEFKVTLSKVLPETN